MKHTMPKQRMALKTRIAIAGLSMALPCTFLVELPASASALKSVDYPYVLTTAISQTSTTVGISAFDLTTSTPAQVNSTLDLLEGLGVTDIRISIPWNQIESYQGGYDWSGLDTIVNAAEARNMGVVGILEKTPAWAVRPGQPPVAGPPRSPALLANFATAVATRYTGKIAAYELYNEPNLALAFSTLSPADYTAMLKAVYPAIKAADPAALVIGGVVGSTPEINFLTLGPDTFVRGMYAAGAQGYFDALSFHPYNWGLRFSQSGDIPNQSLFQLALIRQIMVANGDEAKQIWATEYGVPSATNGESQQAVMLADMLNTWKTLSYAGPVFIHTAVDRLSGSTVPEDTFGIFTSSYTAKLAAAIIQQAIAGTLPAGSTPVATEQAAIASALFINSLASTWNALTSVFKPFVDAFNALVSSVLEALTPKIPTAVPVASAVASASRSADTSASQLTSPALASAEVTSSNGNKLAAADGGVPASGTTDAAKSTETVTSALVHTPVVDTTTTVTPPKTPAAAAETSTDEDAAKEEDTATDESSATGGSTTVGGNKTEGASTTTGGATTGGSASTPGSATTPGSSSTPAGANKTTSSSSSAAGGSTSGSGSTGSASSGSDK